jgi:hypothetical protein
MNCQAFIQLFLKNADNFYMPTEQLTIRLPPELIAKIDFFAEQETRSRNNMIEVLVKEALKSREAKPPK